MATGNGTTDRIIYVSSSDGNDSDDGFSEANAKATISAGLSLWRDGTGDRLLLKRGDTFTGQPFGDLSAKDGRSSTEPLSIGTYGTGNRPRILTGDSSLIIYHGAHLIIQGIYAEPHTRSANEADLNGMDFNGSGLLIVEDCHLSDYKYGVVCNTANAVLRRNLITDCRNTVENFSGFYTAASGNKLHDNIFFNNGLTAASLNHDSYFDTWSRNGEEIGNFFGKCGGGSHKCKPSDGTFVCTNNIWYDQGASGCGGDLPDEQTPNGLELTFEDNIVVEGSGFDFQNLDTSSIARNLFANSPDGANGGFALLFWGSMAASVAHGCDDVTIEDNIFYKFAARALQWIKPTNGAHANNTIQNNQILEPSLTATHPPFGDASCLVESDAASLSALTFSNNNYHRGGTSADWFWNGTAMRTFAQWVSSKEATATSVNTSFTDATRNWTSFSQDVLEEADGDAGCEALLDSEPYSLTRFEKLDAFRTYMRVGFDMEEEEEDTTPPQSTLATIPSAGTTLVLDFDEDVTGTEELGWSITSDGGAVTATGGSGSGTDQLTLTLSRTVLATETLTLDYEDGTGDLEDAAGNDLADISDAGITNESTQEAEEPPPDSGGKLVITTGSGVLVIDVEGEE